MKTSEYQQKVAAYMRDIERLIERVETSDAAEKKRLADALERALFELLAFREAEQLKHDQR